MGNAFSTRAAGPPAAATGNSYSASAAAPPAAATGNSASAPPAAATGNSASGSAAAPAPAAIGNSASASASASAPTSAAIGSSASASASAPSPAAIGNSGSTCAAAPTPAAIGASASASTAMADPASSNHRNLMQASKAREDPASTDLHPVVPASAPMADPSSSSNIGPLMQAVTAMEDPASSDLRPVEPASAPMADPSSSNIGPLMQAVTAMKDTALRPAPVASRAMMEAAGLRPLAAAALLASLPQDVELLELLHHHVESGKALPSWIHTVDVYGDQPGLLTGAHPKLMAANGTSGWYFISTVRAKTEHSRRKNRAVCSGDGYWKTERKAECVRSFDQNGKCTVLGWNLGLSYIKKEGGDKNRTGFLMHQLTRGAPEVPGQLAICRIYKSTWGKNKKKIDERARSEAPSAPTKTSDPGSSALPSDATAAAAAAAATSAQLPVLPMAAWHTPPAPTPSTLSPLHAAGPTAALAAAAKGHLRSTTKTQQMAATRELQLAAINAAAAVAAGTTWQPSWCSSDAMALFAKERQRAAATPSLSPASTPSLSPAATEVTASSQRQWISIQIDADDSTPSPGKQSFKKKVYSTRLPVDEDEPATQTAMKKRKFLDCQGWLVLETGAKKPRVSPGLTA